MFNEFASAFVNRLVKGNRLVGQGKEAIEGGALNGAQKRDYLFQ